MATAFPEFHNPALQPVSRVIEIPSFSLLGKTVFISGGSRGIGRACALTLAPDAESVCAEIRELGRRARAYGCDVGARREVEAMCGRVNDDFDGIDVLVNNAGINRDRAFRRMDREAWDEVINTNLNSVFEITRRLSHGH